MRVSASHVLPQICSLQNDAVILANGLFPSDIFLVNIIKHTPQIIACDGALLHLIQQDIEPHYIVGDCDSIATHLLEKYRHKTIHVQEQDSNDLTKALHWAKEKKLSQIIILGATGLREDHTLGNISILAQHIHNFKNISIISDHGIFTAHHTSTILKTIPHQQISFFAFNPNTTITCKELKWQLQNFTMDYWNKATLNEAIGNEIDIHINKGTIIVFRSFEIRS